MSEQKEVVVSTTSTESQLTSVSDLTEKINMLFSYNNLNIRVVGTTENPWFSGKDIASVLGYDNTVKAIKHNVDEDDKKLLSSLIQEVIVLPSDFSQYDLSSYYINESGFYSLILKSRLESAKIFKKWVTSEVLPAIRKTGQYRSEQRIAQLEQEKQLAIDHAESVKEEKTRVEHELKLSREKELKLMTRIETGNLVRQEIFYVATTRHYSTLNRFKVGGVASMKRLIGRLSNYNSGRAENDLYYYVSVEPCLAYKPLESMLFAIIGDFRDKQDSTKELFNIPYPYLIEKIHQLVNTEQSMVDSMNSRRLSLSLQLLDIGEQPPAIDVATLSCVGQKKLTKKINVSTWDDAKREDMLIDLIDKYGSDLLGEPYSYRDDRDDVTLVVNWMEFSKLLSDYEGLTKLEWRGLVSDLCHDGEQIGFKVICK